VVKWFNTEVCKTSIQRFESARRLHFLSTKPAYGSVFASLGEPTRVPADSGRECTIPDIERRPAEGTTGRRRTSPVREDRSDGRVYRQERPPTLRRRRYRLVKVIAPRCTSRNGYRSISFAAVALGSLAAGEAEGRHVEAPVEAFSRLHDNHWV
jgi:hypothetical protein